MESNVEMDLAVPRVVIADDDPLVRRVLKNTLEGDGFVVVAGAGTGTEALTAVKTKRPDLLVLDLAMPDGDGLWVIQQLRAGGGELLPIVVLTYSQDDEEAVEALRAGAVGVVSKDAVVDDLGKMLRAALAGEALISGRLGTILVERLRSVPENHVGTRPVRSVLTPREWEVLDLLCESRSTQEIASALFVSTETVRSHIKSILKKLGVSSRGEAVAAAPKLRLAGTP